MSWAGQGSTRRWRKLRAMVLERDGYACQIRGPRCTGYATHVDHLAGWSGRPESVPPHLLRAACRPCNQQLSDTHHAVPDQLEHRGRTRW